MALMTMLQGSEDTLPTYWQHDCLWLVVSSRIENNAKALGLTKIINSGGANSTVLADSIKALTTNKNLNAVFKQK